jgi:hypothetical protein
MNVKKEESATMTKELTPLKAFKELREQNDFLKQRNIPKEYRYDDELDIVETALKEHELMKKARFIVANKEISDDALEKLKNQRMFIGSLERCEIKPLFDEDIENKLKALEIIKEKEVDIHNLLISKTAEQYNGYTHWLGYKGNLTQEEFDTVKEALL